jgi:hypothetical protein
MKHITKVISKRIPAFITPAAHSHLPLLCEAIAKEKGLSDVSFLDAASIAILEAVERRSVEQKTRRTEREKVTA